MDKQRGRMDPGLIYLLIGIIAFVAFLFALPEPAESESAGEATPETNFAIVDALVFDGERFLPHRDVWVEDGLIKAVGRRLDLPEHLARIDGRGHTVVPGLIDGHAHSFNTALTDALRFGVTSVLDQFTSSEIARETRATRTVLAATDQADLYSAGMIGTAPDGHGTQFGIPVEPVTGSADAPAWVRARKAEGSDWIKIAWEDGSAFGLEIASLDRDTVAALIAAAHAEGLRALVHISTKERALAAMELGADGLVHVWADELISEEDAARIAASEMFIIPTLSIVSPIAGKEMSRNLFEGVDHTLLSAMQNQTLASASPFAATAEDTALENVRRLHAAGVTLIAGTDAPNPSTAYGVSMHGELQLLMQAGLSAAEALAAATGVPATAFELDDRGHLDEGRIADLLLIRGDLSEDMSTSRNIVTLWKDGYPVDRRGSIAAISAATPAPAETLISHFDGEEIDTAFGAGWSVTDDTVMGGRSNAAISISDGALLVSGAIHGGFAYPWAGAIWVAGNEAATPTDFTGREALSFRVRGDGRQYQVMLFSQLGGGGAPPSVAFSTSGDWTTVTIPLAEFPTQTPEIIAALAFVAVAPAGSYAFELDDVEIR
jgi:imidazolonepropionase-like amidohydrolase